MPNQTSSAALRPIRPLRRGGRIRIVAPSSPFPMERLRRGIDRLESAGFVVEVAPDILRRDHAYLNGDDALRLAELNAALASDADVIWLARGGYGLTRIVSKIEVPPGDRPLPQIIGFSDATALLSRLQTLGVPSIHGPLATSLAGEDDKSFEHTISLLSHSKIDFSLECRRHQEAPLTTSVRGWLYPANLCVLTHLIATSALPSLRDAIVVLEEIGERPYRIDRMLTHLVESGAFDGIRALAIGHLSGCNEPTGSGVVAPSPLDVVFERSPGVPVVSGLPVGHVAPNFALPVGAPAEIVSVDDKRASLRFSAAAASPSVS